jgi:hypothetical protein
MRSTSSRRSRRSSSAAISRAAGGIQQGRCAFDLRNESSDAGFLSRDAGTGEGDARHSGLQPAHGDAGKGQFASRPQRRGQWRGHGESELALGLVKMAQQQEAPHFEMKGMGGVHTISARLQRRTRGSQILFRPP